MNVHPDPKIREGARKVFSRFLELLQNNGAKISLKRVRIDFEKGIITKKMLLEIPPPTRIREIVQRIADRNIYPPKFPKSWTLSLYSTIDEIDDLILQYPEIIHKIDGPFNELNITPLFRTGHSRFFLICQIPLKNYGFDKFFEGYIPEDPIKEGGVDIYEGQIIRLDDYYEDDVVIDYFNIEVHLPIKSINVIITKILPKQILSAYRIIFKHLAPEGIENTDKMIEEIKKLNSKLRTVGFTFMSFTKIDRQITEIIGDLIATNITEYFSIEEVGPGKGLGRIRLSREVVNKSYQTMLDISLLRMNFALRIYISSWNRDEEDVMFFKLRFRREKFISDAKRSLRSVVSDIQKAKPPRASRRPGRPEWKIQTKLPIKSSKWFN